MKRLACENCGANTESGWSFCPKCGAELKRKNFLEYGMADVLAKFADSLAKKLLFDIQANNAEKNDTGFTVKIMHGQAAPRLAGRGGFAGEPERETRRLSELNLPLKARPAPKETLEPKASFNKMPGKLVVEVDVPGVKSLDDVDIFELGTSVEVRAYSGDTLYYKIINVPKKSAVMTKKVEDEKVILEMSA